MIKKKTAACISYIRFPQPGTQLVGLQPRNLLAFVLFILLIAIWLPITMILNDGIALSSVLMVAQTVLCITALERSNKGKFLIAGDSKYCEVVCIVN